MARKYNLNGVEYEMTAEQETAFNEKAEQELADWNTQQTQKQADKEANDALKASAKAKLIAGEALTEDEANTIVI
jgi:hypothetical protein